MEAGLTARVVIARGVFVILAMGVIEAKAAENCVGGVCQAPAVKHKSCPSAFWSDVAT